MVRAHRALLLGAMLAIFAILAWVWVIPNFLAAVPEGF